MSVQQVAAAAVRAAPARHGTHETRQVPRYPLAVGLAVTALYSTLSLVRWARMDAGVDLAIFAQAAQRYAHLQLPFSGVKAVDGFNLLGDHFSPAVALFAPAYWLVPHAWTLLVVQSALVGLAAGLLTRAAGDRLGARCGVSLGLTLALAWGIQSMSLFDVHEVAFAVPLLVLAYLRVVWTYWSSSAASPAGGGVLGNAFGALRDATVSGAAPALALVLLAPTLGLALRSPLLLGVLPVLASRWTSPNPSYWGPGLHYDATVTVVAVLAAYDTLVRLQERNPGAGSVGRWAAGALAATLVVSVPGPAVHLVRAAARGCDGCRTISGVLGLVPDGALVAADDHAAPYLVDRTRVIGLHSHFRDSTGRVIEPQYVAFDRARADAWTKKWINEHFHSDQAEEIGEAVRIGQADGESYDVVVFRVRPGARL